MEKQTLPKVVASLENFIAPIQVAIALGAEIPAIVGSYYFALSLTSHGEDGEKDIFSHLGEYPTKEAALIALSNHIILTSVGAWNEIEHSGGEEILACRKVIESYFDFWDKDSYDIARRVIKPIEVSLALGNAADKEGYKNARQK